LQSCSCGGKIEADIRGGDQFGTGDLICTKCGKIHEEKISHRNELSQLRQSEQLGGKISNTLKDFEKKPLRKGSRRLVEKQKFVKQDEYEILIHKMLAHLDKKFLNIGSGLGDSPESVIYSESYNYIKKFKKIKSLKTKETKIKVCTTYYLVARKHERQIGFQEIIDSVLTKNFTADIVPTSKNCYICKKHLEMSDTDIKKMKFTNRQLVGYLKAYFKAKKGKNKKMMEKMKKIIKSGHISDEDSRKDKLRKNKRKQTRQKDESTPYLKMSKLIQKHFPELYPYSLDAKNGKKSNAINKFISKITISEPKLTLKLQLKVESKYKIIKMKPEFASKSEKGIIATLSYLTIKELEKTGLEFSINKQTQICEVCDKVHPTTMTTNIKDFKNIKF
jgi:hypothetical protein